MTSASMSTTAAIAPLEFVPGISRWKQIRRRLNGRAFIGGSLVAVALLVAIFAPVLAPNDPEYADITMRLQPPAWQSGGSTAHLLGTDALGRDLLSRIIYGARISLMISFTAVILAASIGVTLGLLAGYFGGIVDLGIMRMVDIMFAFPFLLLAITWMAIFSPGQRNVIAVLVLTGWATFARLTRGQVLSMKQREYVVAARVLGASSSRMITRHVLPNLIPTIIVIGTMTLAQFILAEAALSFLGLGVPPQTPTWGGLVNEGRDYITQAWWIETFPGIAIVLTVTGIGLLGDWMRDVLDPRLRSL